MLKKLSMAAMTVIVVLCTATLAHARLVRIKIAERSTVLDAKAFGAVRNYERIVGRAYFLPDS